jgi:hypothetical protein
VPRLGASCGEGRRGERADERTAGEGGRDGLSSRLCSRLLNGPLSRLGRRRCDGRR